MRNHGEKRTIELTAAFLLAFACAGCGCSWMPQFLSTGHTATVSASEVSVPPKVAPPPGPVGPPHATEGIVPASYESPSQALSTLSQRLAAVEDDRTVLAARLQEMQGLVEIRDQTLVASAREIEAARAEVVATRSEMERWKEKMATLQERMRGVEKEDMGTLQSIIKLLEQAVEEGKELSPAKPTVGQPETKPAESREGR